MELKKSTRMFRTLLLTILALSFVERSQSIKKHRSKIINFLKHDPETMFKNKCSAIDPKTLQFTEDDLYKGIRDLGSYLSFFRVPNTESHHIESSFSQVPVLSTIGKLAMFVPILICVVSIILFNLILMFYYRPKTFSKLYSCYLSIFSSTNSQDSTIRQMPQVIIQPDERSIDSNVVELQPYFKDVRNYLSTNSNYF